MNYLKMNAFNLVPGVTWTEGYEGDASAPVWVVMTVHRTDSERVLVWCRRADEIIEEPGQSVENKSFDFDYCDPIAVVGICIHPLDPDDNDWGN